MKNSHFSKRESRKQELNSIINRYRIGSSDQLAQRKLEIIGNLIDVIFLCKKSKRCQNQMNSGVPIQGVPVKQPGYFVVSVPYQGQRRKSLLIKLAQNRH